MILFSILSSIVQSTAIGNKEYNLSEWNQRTFPHSIGRLKLGAIGYDLDHSIFIVGGMTELNHDTYDNVFIVDTLTNSFLYQEHILSEPVLSGGQSYCQIDRMIYMISNIYGVVNYIHTYDMSIQKFTANAYHIENDDTYTSRSCLTNIDNHRLALVGGWSFIAQGNSTVYSGSKHCGILNLVDSSYIKVPNTYHSRDLATCESTPQHLYAIGGGVWPGSNTVEMIQFDTNNIATISTKSWYMLADRLSYRVTDPKSVLYNHFIYIIGGEPTPILPGVFYVIDTHRNSILRLNNISVDHLPLPDNTNNAWVGFGMAQHMVTATYTKLYSFGGNYIDKFVYASFANPIDALPWEYQTEVPTYAPSIQPTKWNYSLHLLTKQPSQILTKEPSHTPTKQLSNDSNNTTSTIVIIVLGAIVFILIFITFYLIWRNKKIKRQYREVRVM